jgi:glutamate formiminotransferase / formiminotetrahydrofolate cyclodeaminase
MQKLIECVPNFSEGRDENIIRQITDAIKSVDGVSLLDADPRYQIAFSRQRG